MVRLSVPMEGVTALEQIIISKLMLYSYLYHHHKIRCIEGMYHQLLKRYISLSREERRSNGKKRRRTKPLPDVAHPAGFLTLSDRSLLPDAWPPDTAGDEVAGRIVSMLTRRDLYKRALIISRLFVRDIDTDQEAKSGFEKLLACGTNGSERDALCGRIVERTKELMSSRECREATRDLRKRLSVGDVLIDIPKSPTVEETHAVMIPMSSGAHSADEKFVPLSEVFPIEKWVDAYNAIKWRGHVFAIEEAAPFVNKAALDILSAAPYHLRFTSQATELCKIPDGGAPRLF